MNTPDLSSLKHKPIVLLPYADHDGEFPENSDCKFLSIGWAQWNQRELSVKVLRYTGERWSRQSEEIPLHRCLDAALLIATAVEQAAKGEQQVSLDAGVLEHQQQAIDMPIETRDRLEQEEFATKLISDLLLRRLGKLFNALNSLQQAGVWDTTPSDQEDFRGFLLNKLAKP